MNEDLILQYFPDLTPEQIRQFGLLQALYTDRNSKINVISRKDIHLLYERHVLHSLGIAKVMAFETKTKVMDVGTGGGFPGIPLAILFPEASFTLVDSIGKKIKVVQSVAESIGLKNVNAIHTRVENVDDQFHFVVSRAVSQMSEFMLWLKGKFEKENFNAKENGILYLKGGDLSEELQGLQAEVYNLSDYFNEEFFETKKVVYLPKSKMKLN